MAERAARAELNDDLCMGLSSISAFYTLIPVTVRVFCSIPLTLNACSLLQIRALSCERPQDHLIPAIFS